MRIMAALLLCLHLVACAGSGNIKWENVRQLQVGMTEKEVINKMGRPYSVTAKADGSQVWIWVHVNLAMGTKSVGVTMKDGKVTQAPKVPDSF